LLAVAVVEQVSHLVHSMELVVVVLVDTYALYQEKLLVVDLLVNLALFCSLQPTTQFQLVPVVQVQAPQPEDQMA
jgi:hypothetical protein